LVFFVAQLCAAHLGDLFRRTLRPLDTDEGEDFGTVLTATLTLLGILQVIASIAYFLIADIDSPRGGVIEVAPQNLISVSQSIKAQQRLNP